MKRSAFRRQVHVAMLAAVLAAAGAGGAQAQQGPAARTAPPSPQIPAAPAPPPAERYAPQQPQGLVIFGAKDFEMDWRIMPANRQVRVRFLAEPRILRIEALDGSAQVMLKNLRSGAVTILVEEGRKGVYAGQGAPAPRQFGEPSGRLRDVAGEQCQDFVAGNAALCLARDGIPLVVTTGPQTIIAERVLRQAQPAGLFMAPKDVKPKPIPGSNPSALLPF